MLTTSSDNFDSVPCDALLSSSNIFDVVPESEFEIISAIVFVKSKSSVDVPSDWFLAAWIVCVIIFSLFSSLKVSILSGFVSTIVFITFADKACFSSVEFLVTSVMTLFITSSLAPDTIFPIKSASSCDEAASSTADTVSFWIWSALFWASDSNFSEFFSEKSAITFNDNLEFWFVFFSVILFITENTVASSDLAMTLLKIAADLSVSLATIVSKIFSFIKPAPSEVEVVKNLLSLSDKFSTTPSTRLSLVSIIFSITSPVFFSSDWLIRLDKNSVFSSFEFSTIKFIFSFFSSVICSFANSTSLSSTIPSLLASWSFPSSNFFWSCWVISFSSIFDDCINVSLTDFSISFSSSDLSLDVASLFSEISKTCSVDVILEVCPPLVTSIEPTLPKLSAAREILDLPSGFRSTSILVPLNPSDDVVMLTIISPSSFLAIDPDSITIFPFNNSAFNFGLFFEFSNSLTFIDVSSFIIIAVLSLNWIVADEPWVTNISSFKKIGSWINKSLSSSLSLIATIAPFNSVTEPILFSFAKVIEVINKNNIILIKQLK